MKKKNFGITLLKAFVIAVVFGIVAACAFEATAYYLGDQFKLPYIGSLPLEEASGEEGAPETEEEKETEDTKDSEETIKEPAAASSAASEKKSDADLVEAAMPSIVAITNISTVEYSTFWGQRGSYESESAASGIL